MSATAATATKTKTPRPRTAKHPASAAAPAPVVSKPAAAPKRPLPQGLAALARTVSRVGLHIASSERVRALGILSSGFREVAEFRKLLDAPEPDGFKALVADLRERRLIKSAKVDGVAGFELTESGIKAWVAIQAIGAKG